MVSLFGQNIFESGTFFNPDSSYITINIFVPKSSFVPNSFHTAYGRILKLAGYRQNLFSIILTLHRQGQLHVTTSFSYHIVIH